MLNAKGFSVLLAAGCAQACATAPVPENTVAAPVAPEEREQTADGAMAADRVCREVPGTGWRLGNRRECKTQAEWEALDARGGS